MSQGVGRAISHRLLVIYYLLAGGPGGGLDCLPTGGPAGGPATSQLQHLVDQLLAVCNSWKDSLAQQPGI